MVQAEALGRVVQRVARQVRWRRTEYHALRGLFYGAVAAALVLVFKTPLGLWAVPLAGGLVVLGSLAGALWGFCQPVAEKDAARLADGAFELKDRVATALEWAARPDRTPLVDALVADAIAHVEALATRQIVRRLIPSEARWLPVPAVIALALAFSPPLPLPSVRLPNLLSSTDSAETKERGETAMMEQDRRLVPKDALKRPAMEERDFNQQRGATGASPTAGDLSAIFKDTSLGNQRPDFNSFLKKGDERLKLLEQVDRLPDLQSDFTQSQYKMVFRKSKALTGGLRPDQISPQKLRELLEEMERLGRKGGANWSGDAAEGMEALEGGQPDRALEAMEKALNKMRAMDEQGRGGKNLRGGRERASSGRERGRGTGGGPDEQDFGEGEGFLPGKGKSASPKGEASQRVRASPYDVGVEGESRQGRKDGYDTNMTGRGGKMGSRLSYLGVIGQYRKMMEDAITREQVPRDYHSQIKEYFQALDER